MRSLLVLALPVLLVACGSSSSAGEDGSATDATSIADDDGSTTSSAFCEEMYQDATDLPGVEITFRHEGTTPVFVEPHGCGGAFAYHLAQDGVELPVLLDPECHPSTCRGFVNSTDCSVGCNDCAPPSAVRLDPGAMGLGVWKGDHLTEVALASECAPAAECPDTCVNVDPAEPGIYELSIVAYRTCTGVCECDPPSDSGCSLYNGEQLADPMPFSASVDYPTQTLVEIVITD